MDTQADNARKPSLFSGTVLDSVFGGLFSPTLFQPQKALTPTGTLSREATVAVNAAPSKLAPGQSIEAPLGGPGSGFIREKGIIADLVKNKPWLLIGGAVIAAYFLVRK